MNDSKVEAKAEKQGQITEQVGKLDKEIASLQSVVAGVVGKMEPLCREQDPQEVADSQPLEPLASFANDLRSLGNQVRNARRELESIVDRLEL